jgi:hypothetical protein
VVGARVGIWHFADPRTIVSFREIGGSDASLLTPGFGATSPAANHHALRGIFAVAFEVLATTST